MHTFDTIKAKMEAALIAVLQEPAVAESLVQLYLEANQTDNLVLPGDLLPLHELPFNGVVEQVFGQIIADGIEF